MTRYPLGSRCGVSRRCGRALRWAYARERSRRPRCEPLEDRRLLSSGLAAALPDLASAPSLAAAVWRSTDLAALPATNPEGGALPTHFQAFSLCQAGLNSVLGSAPLESFPGSPPPGTELDLPRPDGTWARFSIVEVPILAPQIAAQFPAIHTYRGQGIDDPTATLSCDVTSAGFHAFALTPKGSYCIDPLSRSGDGAYMSYFWTDDAQPPQADGLDNDIVPNPDYTPVDTAPAQPPATSAGTQAATSAAVVVQPATGGGVSSGTVLRDYALAVAADGEFTAQFGGRDAAFAEIVSVVNDVAAIYNRDLMITFHLVSGTNLVYTNPATDPYDNSSQEHMLDENQDNVDSVIGSDNYSIAQVWGTNGGGLAMIGSVGEGGFGHNRKAEGYSGWEGMYSHFVKVVAHEMGHQFGANHTFNASEVGHGGDQQRNDATSVEPDAGRTIMSYAPVATEVPFFHAVSIDEILNYVNDPGHQCGWRFPTSNHVPIVYAGPDYLVPDGTEFTLTAQGFDADHDTLTYTWQSMDIDGGDGYTYNVPTENPSTDFYARSLDGYDYHYDPIPMHFRVTARDGRGGVSSSDMTVTVIASTESDYFRFHLNDPFAAWYAGSPETVTWETGGTESAPFNASTVDILLSIDGGATFPYVLAHRAPNTGTAQVTVPPEVPTSHTCVLRLAPCDNIFHSDVSGGFAVVHLIGPRVLRTQTDNPTAVSALRFYFSEQMDYGSFNPKFDIDSFVGPHGESLRNSIQSYNWQDNDRTLEIRFDTQYGVGRYQMTIGPGIDDASGNAMNLDGVLPNGKSTDRYAGSFEIQPQRPWYEATLAYNPFWMLDGPWFWGQRTSGADPAHGDFGDNLIGYNSAGGYPSYMSATDYATMPSVDCSGSVGTQLSFWRYLGVDASNRAHASIQVHGRMAAHQALAPSASAAADPADQSDDGWVTIWSNPDTALIDDGWVYQEFDISAIADGQSDVQVRFGMGPTNGAKSYCGWNLDDIKISGVQNQAPLLTPAGPALGQTTPQAPLEVALAAFINNGPDTTQIFDPDTTAACGGIAVTGTTGSGTWEYSFDETGFYPVGNVSDGAALLLPASALLRYTPDGEHGETPTITYRGWDTTCGSYGGRLDATSSGGIWPCSAVTDTASLLVRSTPYYVNDGSTANDAWCTAPGNDANDGLSPATPKASVQAILNAYQLLPGDVVWIDTGTYKLTKNIVVGTADGGDAGGRVQFLASPYGVSFQRNSTAPGAYAWQIQASYVTLATEAAISHPEWPQSWMQVTGGFAGVDIASDDLPSGDSGHVTLSRCDTAGNYAAGILVSGKPSQQVLIENCLARNSSQPGGGAGISVEGGATATVQNCTVDGNAAYGIFVSGAPGTQLHNNIVCAEGPNALAISSDGLAASDYNDLYATGGAWVGYWGGYQLTLAEWQTATGLDGDSLSQDPLFADAVGGDLHLMSRSGRYVPATDLWVADTADSPCIDRGDPASDYSLEPPLNGGRINLGAYGNTDQASKTYVQPEVTGMALIQKALTYESTVSYAVTFNEPVSGVDADDFQTVGDLAGRPIVDVWGSGTTWIVSVDAGPGEGSLQLKLVDDDSIVDAGQNPLGGLGAGNGDYTGPACTLDHTPPKVSIEPVVPSLRNTPVEQIVIDFSEPVQGFDLSRLQLCLNGGVDLLLGDGTDPLPPATAPTLTSSDGKTWVLGNLSGLTAAPGGYTLSLTSGGLPVTDLAGNSLTGSPTVQWLLPTAVVGRMVFYNTPQYAPTDPQDVVVYDDAIAPDKTALLPGQTAGFANYTTYTCGINGVMVDLANLCYPPTLDDFQFRLGNSSDPATWAALSTLPAMTVRWAEGLGGSDRISLVWPDGTIVNTWLQVTVKAGLDTGLAADDVFYFGNAVGDTGNLPKGATQVVVDAADEQAVRTHESGFNPVDLANPYDFNRDGQVNATDELIARHNRTGANPLELITAPAAGGKGNAPAAGMGGLTNAGTVTGGLTIEGGTHYFAPNTQNTIAVTASGGAAVEGMNLCVQVGDGGQANGGTNTQPTITALDITGKGTLFSASNTGSSPQQDGPLMWMASTTTDENAAATLPAAGDVALVTIDTKGTAAGQSFPLRLSDVAGSIFAGGIGSDFAGITPSVQDGRLVVVDMAWRPGASGNWWASDWDGGPAKFPDASINAAIDTPATVTIDGPQSVHSLAVAHGGHLVIAANGSLTVGGPLIIGEGGTIEVQAGGTLIVPALDQDSGAGTLLLDGGRLEATASFASSIPIFLDAQGGTVDTAGFNLDLAGSLTGPGGLTKMGLGQLSLDAANYYADRTTVSTGVMEIGGADALPRGTSLTVGGGGGGGGVVLWQVLEPIVLGFGAGAGSPVTPSSISSTADAIVSRVQPAPLSPTAVAATAPAETGVQSAPAAGFQTAATAEPTPVVAPGSAAETTRGPRWVQTVLAAASIKITTDQRAWAKSADMGMPAASKADLSRSHDVVLQFRGVRPSLRDVAWLTAFDELNTRNQSSRKDALPAYATDEVLARYSQQ